MMDKPEEFKVNSRNLDLNLDFGFSITANEGKISVLLQGVPVGVNVAGQRFYYVHLLPSARVAKFQRCTDQQRQDYPGSA